MKHTPGSWTVRKVGPRPHLEVMGPNDSSIAAMYGNANDVDNAHLIAAAPDLLAALREMLHQFADHEQYDEDGHDTAAINKARAAIAKAEGQA